MRYPLVAIKLGKKRQKGLLDKKQQREFDERHLRIQEALKKAHTTGLSRSELKNLTKIKSNITIRKHLKRFFNDGEVKEKNRRLLWGTHYAEMLTENLEVACQEIQTIEKYMFKPDKIEKWKKENSFYPSKKAVDEDMLEGEELFELLEHRKKVLALLDQPIVNLIKLFMELDGRCTAKSDLSNVVAYFKNDKLITRIADSPIDHEMLELIQEKQREDFTITELPIAGIKNSANKKLIMKYNLFKKGTPFEVPEEQRAAIRAELGFPAKNKESTNRPISQGKKVARKKKQLL